MITKNHVFRSTYRDSVVLMRWSRELEGLDGVDQATVIMGTENNKGLLRQAGLLNETGEVATPNDLIVALRFESLGQEAQTMELLQSLFAKGSGGPATSQYSPRTLETALQSLPDANLAVISLPGIYAATEARKALEHGLDVLLFSDNVSLQDEIELKQRAIARGLMMLGPDCGTAIINGVPLGFANAVPTGRVGLVSASGTGLQYVTCLLASAGEGVSLALGVGGRDTSDPVGGLMMLEGISALQADSNTEIIVLISKPPGKATQERVLAALRNSSKPCIVAFLGDDGSLKADEGIFIEKTLEAAAGRVLSLLGKEPPGWSSIPNEAWERLQLVSANLASGQSAIRGLFSGGTLCYEALLLLREMGQEVSSNLALPGVNKYKESGRSQGHVLIDLGDDEYTVGRPHPMIDARACSQKLISEAAKPEVGVILLDVVLGYGSNPDPASELAPALQEARLRAAQEGRGLACVVMLCGTDDDPQGLARQEKTLTEAGAIVVRSNTLATGIAVSLSSRDLSGLEDYRE